MSQTIIAQSSKQKHPGENQKYVNSRQGGPMEASRTKTASAKHANPEYFKRQSDRKNRDSSNENVGRGTGQVGKDSMKSNENVGRGIGQDRMKKDNIPARKDIPIQSDKNKHQENVGRDPGRGTGQVGRDQGNFQMKQFSRGTMY
jgi:hypothetical protein